LSAAVIQRSTVQPRRRPSASTAATSASAIPRLRQSGATNRSSMKPPVEAANGRANGLKCTSPAARSDESLAIRASSSWAGSKIQFHTRSRISGVCSLR
jgi:hypothetical protein